MTVNNRIANLRKAMKVNGLDAYIIPSSDPHQSEYVADYWKSRQWISGFTGSAGTVIITNDHAGVWVDSRYFIQAEKQLASSEAEMHKQEIPHAPEHITWILDNLKKESRVGCDGRLFSVGQINNLEKAFNEKSIELITDQDLIAGTWKDRIPLPTNKIFEHNIKYAGANRNEKLAVVREKMKKKGTDYHFVSTLDDIAYVLNLRGSDVECNPIFYAYLIIGENESHLFVESSKVDAALANTLKNENVLLHSYMGVRDFLLNLPKEKSILVDPDSINALMYHSILPEQRVYGGNIIRAQKAIKNETEIAHIRKVMEKDGVALLRLFRWLEATVQERSVPETEVAEKLIECRRAQGNYHGESFDAIVGYNGNGAIVHYRAEKNTCANIENKGMLLLDSGGQYEDGTTDITRTICFGEPSEEQKRNYTLVLKGHIALATIKFPDTTTGVQLDTLARMYLWRENLNYGHGTGHGVGFFLNVHEPPQGFATGATTSRGTTPFRPGMFTSNEPGFYKNNEYGIRIENLILCVKGEENDFGKFLEFETLTLFPIAQNLIEKSLLTKEEKDWLNDYHVMVFEKLSPRLEGEELAWLKERCQEI